MFPAKARLLAPAEARLVFQPWMRDSGETSALDPAPGALQDDTPGSALPRPSWTPGDHWSPTRCRDECWPCRFRRDFLRCGNRSRSHLPHQRPIRVGLEDSGKPQGGECATRFSSKRLINSPRWMTDCQIASKDDPSVASSNWEKGPGGRGTGKAVLRGNYRRIEAIERGCEAAGT